jgi:Uma2 family endonuclease
MAAPNLITAEELVRVSPPHQQVELVRGHLIVREPPGTWHGRIANNLAFALTAFVRPRGLGTVFSQDTGFKIGSDPDTVRGPDVAFVSTDRLGDIPHRGFATLAPDLVAEVLSPDDSAAEVLAKVADWLRAGTKLAWVVDPRRAEVRVYRPDGSTSTVPDGADLSGEEVLPGFSCPVREIFSA